MTDTTHVPASANPCEAWQIEAAHRARLAAEARIVNRAAIFAALADAGITTVTLHFDGYGDSGQIEDVTAFAGDQSKALPSVSVEMAKAIWDGSGLERQHMSLSQAIESLAYDCLESTHSGWEDGDGGYGDFVFDVAAQTIKLDYDERYVAIENYQHDF